MLTRLLENKASNHKIMKQQINSRFTCLGRMEKTKIGGGNESVCQNAHRAYNGN